MMIGVRRRGVQGSGVQGSGVQGSGVQGSGVQGSGVQGSGVQGSGVQGSGVQGSGVPADSGVAAGRPQRALAAPRSLAASAVGRVLELPSDGVEAAVRSECSRGARYDTILSFMRTPQVSDLDGFVAALGEILADEGRILMVEPSGSVNGRLRGWLPSRIGHPRSHRDRAERDVLSALRAGGFAVTDLHRRELASVPSQWRRYVEIRARRETPRASQP